MNCVSDLLPLAIATLFLRLSVVYSLHRGIDRLVGLVVKESVSRAEDPGFESRLRRDFSGVKSYQ